MRLNDIYPPKYATGADLAGKPATLTISHVSMESMRPGPGAPATNKPVMYFARASRGVILGRALWMQIAALLGSDDTDTWTGKRIQIYPEPMTVAGKPRIAIRARQAPNGETQPPAAMVEEEEDIP